MPKITAKQRIDAFANLLVREGLIKMPKNSKTKPRLSGSVLNWDTTQTEADLIHQIAVRAFKSAEDLGDRIDMLSMEMDITACHLNGNRLDLLGLLNAPQPDFGHDVFGIRSHIDRNTGKLKDFFVPRLSAKEQVTE